MTALIKRYSPKYGFEHKEILVTPKDAAAINRLHNTLEQLEKEAKPYEKFRARYEYYAEETGNKNNMPLEAFALAYQLTRGVHGARGRSAKPKADERTSTTSALSRLRVREEYQGSQPQEDNTP